MAPEQAMGRPSFRSDVFALGLVLYQMFSGQLPEYPFAWPPPGYRLLEKRVNAGLLAHAAAVDGAGAAEAVRRRPGDARRVRPREGAPRRPRRRASRPRKSSRRTADWKEIQRRQFQQEFGKVLDTDHECPACHGPGLRSRCRPARGAASRAWRHEGSTDFPLRCPRCRRGMKLDWHYCPWCYGPGFEPSSTREFSDIRYTARCQNASCSRKLLMPFMRYCPWCHRKVRRKWKIPESTKIVPPLRLGRRRGLLDATALGVRSDLADNERSRPLAASAVGQTSGDSTSWPTG